MYTLNTFLLGHELRLSETQILASGSVAFDKVHFDFDDSWAGLSKVALFWGADGNAYGAMVDAEGNAVVPWEALATGGRIKFGVYGVTGSGDNAVRATSTLIYYKLPEGAWTEDGQQPTPAEQTIIEQAIAAIQSAVENLDREPIIRDGIWYTWDINVNDYVSTGVSATGPAAGFGSVSATVDDNTGTPSVEVTSSGPDTAKNFSFAFHNIKGPTGDVTPAAQQAASDAQAASQAASGSATEAAESAQEAEDTAAEIKQKLDRASAYGEVGPVPIAAISDALPLDAAKLVVNIEPVQDLHGYSNPWPAGGGKNKLPNNLTGKTERGITFTVNSDGTVVATGTATGRVSLSAIVNVDENLVDGTSYILSGCPAGGSNTTFQAAIFTAPSYSTQAKDLGNGATFKYVKTSGDSFIIALYVESGYTCPSGGLVFKPMIRLATEEDATFAPYSNICPITGWTRANVTVNEDVLDITFPSEAGTVYGGTLDVVNGVLTVDRGNISSYAGETLLGAWISSMDVYTAGGTPTTGAQVAYELATPITYQLTPQQVVLLRGNNTIFADTGDVTVGYWRDDSLSINKAISERMPDITPLQSGLAALDEDVGALSSAMSYVVSGNKSVETVAIPVGSYVRLVGSTIAGRSDGIYTVAATIPVDTVIDGSYFNEAAPISGGIAGAIQQSLAHDYQELVSYRSCPTTETTYTYSFDTEKYSYLAIMVGWNNSVTWSAIKIIPMLWLGRIDHFLVQANEKNDNTVQVNELTNKRIKVYGTDANVWIAVYACR